MPRQPRIHVPGGFYHVILRGNNRAEIFRGDQDRDDLGKRCAEGLDRFGGRIHAWCWMTNHIHILLQTADRPVGDMIRWLASGYARSFNKAYDRSGHLFERRHKAILVQSDTYLLSLVRYIHLNPIRAGVIEVPEGYRWSSHRAYLGLQNVPWLTTEFVLRQFSQSVFRARKAFQGFTTDSYVDDHDFENGSAADDRILGDEEYCSALQGPPASIRSSKTLDEIISEYCAGTNWTPAELKGPSRQRHFAAVRARITDQAMKGGIATLAEISRAFNRSEAVVLRTLNHWKAKDAQ